MELPMWLSIPVCEYMSVDWREGPAAARVDVALRKSSQEQGVEMKPERRRQLHRWRTRHSGGDWAHTGCVGLDSSRAF